MKLFLKISVLAAFIIVTGVLIFLYTLDINQYKPALVAKVSEQTGRSFSIEGDLEIVPSLTPSITMSGITLGNADWGTAEKMISVGQVVAKISILPLLSGAVHVNQFILQDTEINLEKSPDGSTANWALDTVSTAQDGQPEPERGASPLPPIYIEEIDIRNARISFRDQQTDTMTNFSISEFSTSITDLNDPFSFSLEAEFNDLPITLTGTLGPVNDLLNGNDYPIDISGRLSELELSVNGTVSNALELSGANMQITASAGSVEDLSSLAGSELPDLGPFNLSGIIKFDSIDDIAIDNLIMQLAESSITGTLGMNTGGEVPSLAIRLQSDLIDLSPFASEEEEEVEFLFPRDDLPVEALKSINADVSLTAKLLKLPSLELTDSTLNIRLQGGRLELSNDSGVAGGRLSVALNLQPGNNNLSTLTLDINGSGIKLESLPHEEDEWFTGGETAITIKGRGQGKSIAEIMGSYNGNLLVNVGEATLPDSGVDMVGADILLSTFNRLNPLAGEQSAALLECAVINFIVNDGIIKVDRQIAVQTSKMYMVGSGEINLKTEGLNLGVRPYARQGVGLNLSSVAGAAKIGGTLAKPRAEINAVNALKTGVSAGAAVATGGLSLLAQGLFSKAGTDPEPCNTALGVSSTPPATETTDQAEQPPSAESGNNVIDDVKNTFKGLFGR